MQLLQEFKHHWQQNIHIPPGSRVLAACSGGIDSLALLDMLDRLKETLHIEVAALHFEHGIRGEESRADARFVEAFCHQRQLAVHVGHGDVPAEMARSHESLETAARRLRYAFFYQVRQEYLDREPGRQVYIATAHHQDDQAETVLMHILRGTGLKGLSGIRAVSGCLVRPLLFVGKGALTEYCQARGLEPRHDSTNDEADCLRNKLRLELLPLLEQQYNPSITEGLCRLSRLAEAEESFMQEAADKAFQKIMLPRESGYGCALEALLTQHPALQRRCIQQAAALLTDCQLPYEQVAAVLELADRGKTGTKLQLSFGLMAKISYKFIYIIKKNISFSENNGTMDSMEDYPVYQEYSLPVPGRVELPDGRVITASLADELPELLLDNAVYGDADKCSLPLVVRHRRPGDRIRLKQGSRKLKDFMIDSRIPREERDRLWLVTSGDELLWLAGRRRFAPAMTNTDTKKFFILHIE